jgi:hypothetical protein
MKFAKPKMDSSASVQVFEDAEKQIETTLTMYTRELLKKAWYLFLQQSGLTHQQIQIEYGVDVSYEEAFLWGPSYLPQSQK